MSRHKSFVSACGQDNWQASSKRATEGCFEPKNAPIMETLVRRSPEDRRNGTQGGMNRWISAEAEEGVMHTLPDRPCGVWVVERLEDNVEDALHILGGVAIMDSPVSLLDGDDFAGRPCDDRREVNLDEPVTLELVREKPDRLIGLHPLSKIARAKRAELSSVRMVRTDTEVRRNAESKNDSIGLLGKANGSGFAGLTLDKVHGRVGLRPIPK